MTVQRTCAPCGSDRVLRLGILLIAAAALVIGTLAGLARVGLDVMSVNPVMHGPLMVCGFMGTVIGLERAIALRHLSAFVAPLMSAAATLAMIASLSGGMVFMVLASALLVVLSTATYMRQRAPHTLILIGSAAAWLVGNALYAMHEPMSAVVAWWFTFLVLTVAAERLELTRLARRPTIAPPLFYAAVTFLAVSATVVMLDPHTGNLLFGGALILLAIWLIAFDIARRTVRTTGLPRYAAAALLSGYAWLIVAGASWMLQRQLPQLRDGALHALGIGFVVSMIFAHAPIIFPVVTRTPIRFTPFLYVPLALLHGSLILRLLYGLVDPVWRPRGALLNGIALAVFAFVMLLATSRKVFSDASASEAQASPGTVER